MCSPDTSYSAEEYILNKNPPYSRLFSSHFNLNNNGSLLLFCNLSNLFIAVVMQMICVYDSKHIRQLQATTFTVTVTHTGMSTTLASDTWENHKQAVSRWIWSRRQNSQEKLVRQTEFLNFKHTEISPSLRNLVQVMNANDSYMI